MTKDELKLEYAIKRLKKEYEKALKLKFIHKPLAYAIYQTWKYYDVYEKGRKNVQSSE